MRPKKIYISSKALEQPTTKDGEPKAMRVKTFPSKGDVEFVDLSQVWHDAEEVPRRFDDAIVFATGNGYYGSLLLPRRLRYYDEISCIEEVYDELEHLLEKYNRWDADTVNNEAAYLRKTVERAKEKRDKYNHPEKYWHLANKYHQRWAYLEDLTEKEADNDDA